MSSIQTQHNDPRMVRAQSSPYGVTASIIMSPFKNPNSKTAMRENPAKFEPLSQQAHSVKNLPNRHFNELLL